MNIDNGKEVEVLIEDVYITDPVTKERYLSTRFIKMYADYGAGQFIQDTPGVLQVFNEFGPTQYEVFLDPRYNREFVKKEIEANILCNHEED